MENTEKLYRAFAEGLSIPREEVNQELTYQGIPAWDSMSHLFLVTELENTFGIAIETEDILEMASFEKVTEVLTKYGVQLS